MNYHGFEIDRERIAYLVAAVVAIVVMIVFASKAWAIFAIVAAAAMVLLGVKQYKEFKGHVIERYNERTLVAAATTAAVIFAVLLYSSQGDNMILWYDQTGPSPDLSVASALLLTIIAAVALGTALYFIGRVAGLAMAGYLYTRQLRIPFTRMHWSYFEPAEPVRERRRAEYRSEHPERHEHRDGHSERRDERRVRH